jgi:hypothetical protein
VSPRQVRSPPVVNRRSPPRAAARGAMQRSAERADLERRIQAARVAAAPPPRAPPRSLDAAAAAAERRGRDGDGDGGGRVADGIVPRAQRHDAVWLDAQLQLCCRRGSEEEDEALGADDHDADDERGGVDECATLLRQLEV